MKVCQVVLVGVGVEGGVTSGVKLIVGVCVGGRGVEEGVGLGKVPVGVNVGRGLGVGVR
jgi:hypothetical protein